jgi:hypothetical protein
MGTAYACLTNCGWISQLIIRQCKTRPGSHCLFLVITSHTPPQEPTTACRIAQRGDDGSKEKGLSGSGAGGRTHTCRGPTGRSCSPTPVSFQCAQGKIGPAAKRRPPSTSLLVPPFVRAADVVTVPTVSGAWAPKLRGEPGLSKSRSESPSFSQGYIYAEIRAAVSTFSPVNGSEA